MQSSGHSLMGWLYFILVQLIALALMVVGWVLLLPMSALRLWRMAPSPKYPRSITRWVLLDAIYGNSEDGVVPPEWYMLSRPTWLRVYLWTGWRNSVNNLRWVFLWRRGPWCQVRRWGWYFQAGWRPSNGWPVLSAGAGNGSAE